MIRFEMDRFGNSANHEKKPPICLGEKEKNNIQEEEEKLKFEDNQKKMAGFDPESQKSIDSSTECIEDYEKKIDGGYTYMLASCLARKYEKHYKRAPQMPKQRSG